MRSRHGTCAVVLFSIVAAGFAACGDDGGSPTAPTTPVTPPGDMRSGEDAARQSVDAWLSLLDAGDFSEAYEATGSLFRESVTAEEFRTAWKSGWPGRAGRLPDGP